MKIRSTYLLRAFSVLLPLTIMGVMICCVPLKYYGNVVKLQRFLLKKIL